MVGPNSSKLHPGLSRFGQGPQPKEDPAKRKRADQAEAVKKLEREVNQLATLIRRFRIDSQRFLAGDLPGPPEELRDRIQTEMRRLRGSDIKSTAMNFRLSSLEAEFNSHTGLLGRRLRQKEQGAARQAVEKNRLDPVQGVVVRPGADGGAAEALFEGLNRPKMGIEKFRSYLDRQAETIRSKTGCSDIQFRVAVQDGKLKLKAKPIRG